MFLRHRPWCGGVLLLSPEDDSTIDGETTPLVCDADEYDISIGHRVRATDIPLADEVLTDAPPQLRSATMLLDLDHSLTPQLPSLLRRPSVGGSEPTYGTMGSWNGAASCFSVVWATLAGNRRCLDRLWPAILVLGQASCN